MEQIGAFPEGEWDFYNRIFAVDEPDFSGDFLGPYSFDTDGPPAHFPYNTAVDNAYTSSFQQPFFSAELPSPQTTLSHLFTPEQPYGNLDCHVSGKEIQFSDQRATAQKPATKKRPRPADVTKAARSSKRSSPSIDGEQTSYSSEDDVASQESNGGASSQEALNSSSKARASRGSATDPQSLYARKRRERINERLKILQNLVPNGTKVDISTMLEEAVQYVKFLQLQIKLLSSDDLWMFAPIAYNGVDIGLNQKLSALL